LIGSPLDSLAFLGSTTIPPAILISGSPKVELVLALLFFMIWFAWAVEKRAGQ
jgi:hypothetical protein